MDKLVICDSSVSITDLVVVFKYDKQFYKIHKDLLLKLKSLSDDLMLLGSNPQNKSGNPYKARLVDFINENALKTDILDI